MIFHDLSSLSFLSSLSSLSSFSSLSSLFSLSFFFSPFVGAYLRSFSGQFFSRFYIDTYFFIFLDTFLFFLFLDTFSFLLFRLQTSYPWTSASRTSARPVTCLFGTCLLWHLSSWHLAGHLNMLLCGLALVPLALVRSPTQVIRLSGTCLPGTCPIKIYILQLTFIPQFLA